MRFSQMACAAALTSAAMAAAATNTGGEDATGTTLLASAIQSGSFNDGSDEIGANEANQAKSLTSQNNFINNCAGKTLTNGLQITTGSCNGITMGDIPAKDKMVSSVIIFPTTGGTVPSDTTFNISVQTANLVAGSFTNADATYYAAPQFLSNGEIVGHTHVTVQDLGKSLNPTTALDPTQFAFFKGINDAGNGQGLLQAVVTGGLPAGNYRVCTMASASNHQPVLLPVAQRGTPDDCTKFVVTGNGQTANIAANTGSGGIAAAAAAASAVAAGPDKADPNLSAAAVAGSTASTSTSASVSASASAASAKNNGANEKSGANTGKGGAAAGSTASTSVSASASPAASAKNTGANAKSGANTGKGGAAAGSKQGKGRKQRVRREFIA